MAGKGKAKVKAKTASRAKEKEKEKAKALQLQKTLHVLTRILRGEPLHRALLHHLGASRAARRGTFQRIAGCTLLHLSGALLGDLRLQDLQLGQTSTARCGHLQSMLLQKVHRQQNPSAGSSWNSFRRMD